MDKGGVKFIRWSINAVGPLLWDKDGNHYLLITIDPFPKWAETHIMPSLHSWRAAEFLYNDLVAHWGKLCYVQIGNGAKFVGSFRKLGQLPL